MVVAAMLEDSVDGSAVVAGDLLTFTSYLSERLKRFQQSFAVRALLPADIPETLPPMSGRWRVGVLRAKCQGSDYYIEQIAFIGIVAVDAQAVSA